MKSTLVSVVIATYRRQAMLRDTVASLAALRIPEGVTLEVIVVDNDPQATAREAALELQPRYAAAFPLRYVHETRKGLSYARNRGIEESRGDIVAFLDDDVFVAEGWLEAILDCLEVTKADCVGGRTLIHWEGEPHPALKACERRLVAIDLGEQDFEVRGSRLPGGGNAAFRRSVFERGYRFSTGLGRVGNVLLSGEDTEMFERLRDAGGRIWYCAAATVLHRTGGERLTLDYVARQKYWFGISSALIDRKLRGSARQRLFAVARLAKLLLVLLPRLGAAKIRGDQPAALVARCSVAKQLGYLRGTLLPIPSAVQSESRATPVAPAAVPCR